MSTVDYAKQRSRARFVAGPIRAFVAALTKWTSTGHERIASGPAIIAPYHGSNIDPLVVALAIWDAGRMPHFLAKSTLFPGLLGTALRGLGQIPVIRDSAQAGDSLIHAKAALSAGEAVAIYPQGTLTKDPELWPQRAKTGAARLALETGAPVIPVAHWGLQEVMAPLDKMPKPNRKGTVRVVFGDPVPLDDLLGTRDFRTAADRINAHIAALLAELRGVELPERFAADLAPGRGPLPEEVDLDDIAGPGAAAAPAPGAHDAPTTAGGADDDPEEAR